MRDPGASPLGSPRPAVAGPVDRVSFFDEQRRNRRATWRLAAASALALFVVGVPLSFVLAPLLYAIALIAFNTIHLFMPIPETLKLLDGLGNLAFSLFEHLGGDSTASISTAALLPAIAVWLLPGIAAAVLFWLGIFFLFRHSGIGAIIIGLGARAPKAEDLEEQQLLNLVEEMALAAGVRPPAVKLLDGEASNAAAVGSSLEDATLIVSRRLLDECDREQTEAVIGHLVGSLANGDLRIAFLMTSVLLTFGSLMTVLKTSLGPHGRAAFLKFLRLGLRGWKQPLNGEADRELLRALIAEELEIEDVHDKRVRVLAAPFMLASLSVQWTLFVLIPGLLKPCLALLWRTRRYLADATAVQLTRDPDSLARALLGVPWNTPPGTQAVGHLFIAGPAGSETVADFLTWQGMGFHPPLKRRLMRLRALGAQIDINNARSASPWSALMSRQPALAFVLRTVLGLLLGVAAVACLAAIVLFAFISLFVMGLFIMAIHGVFLGLGAMKAWIIR